MADVSVTFAVGTEQATVTLPVDLPSGGDQTAALQATINTAPDGTEASPTVIDLGGLTHRVDGELNVYQRNHLLIRNGKIDGRLHAGAMDNRHIRIQLSHHITFENIEVEGAHASAGAPGFLNWVGPNGEDWHGHHGFAEAGSTFIHYENCKAHHVYGDGFYTGWHDAGPTNVPSEDITHTNCEAYKTGRQGVSVTATRRWSWTDGKVYEARAWLFDIEPGQADVPCEDVTVDGADCTGAHRLGVAAVSGPGSVGMFKRISLFNVTTDSQAVAAWPVVYALSPAGHPPRDGLTVTGNMFIHNHPRPAIEVTGWVNVVKSPNTINGVVV